MEQTTELTKFQIVTPPDFYPTKSVSIGVFGFGPNDFYKFLNTVPLKEQTVIYTITGDPTESIDWMKKVIAMCDCVFMNKDGKRMVISKTDQFKNVYMIDNKFDTIEKIVRLHGKKY